MTSDDPSRDGLKQATDVDPGRPDRPEPADDPAWLRRLLGKATRPLDADAMDGDPSVSDVRMLVGWIEFLRHARGRSGGLSAPRLPYATRHKSLYQPRRAILSGQSRPGQ